MFEGGIGGDDDHDAAVGGGGAGAAAGERHAGDAEVSAVVGLDEDTDGMA